MKVEHHVTIHSGLNIHAPVFAERMEEAKRLGGNRLWSSSPPRAMTLNGSSSRRKL